MREGLLITAAFAVAGFIGWARAEWRIKRLEHRLDHALADLGEARHEVKRMARISRHPALRSVK